MTIALLAILSIFVMAAISAAVCDWIGNLSGWNER